MELAITMMGAFADAQGEGTGSVQAGMAQPLVAQPFEPARPLG